MSLIVVSSHMSTWQIMTAAGLTFEPEIADDGIFNKTLPAIEHVLMLAHLRAKKIFTKRPHDVVVGTASVLSLTGKKVAPPSTEKEAIELLKRLSGRVHRIYDGVEILSEDRQCAFFAQAKVRMCKLSPYAVKRYAALEETFSSASGYSLLGKGASLVESVNGDRYTAAGLPLLELTKRLDRDFGIKAI